jgi:hypothetical protein
VASSTYAPEEPLECRIAEDSAELIHWP